MLFNHIYLIYALHSLKLLSYISSDEPCVRIRPSNTYGKIKVKSESVHFLAKNVYQFESCLKVQCKPQEVLIYFAEIILPLRLVINGITLPKLSGHCAGVFLNFQGKISYICILLLNEIGKKFHEFIFLTS